VRKGQILAEIDPATLQAQVDQARANVLAARANVEKAKATMEDSKRTRDRNKQLFSKDLIARSDLDTSEANYDSNDAQVNAAVAQVTQTEAALRFAETNLRYTKIVSPVDGIVVSRNIDVGQTVAASFQTPTLFTIAQDLTKMQIDTNIDEADIGKIKKGQDVEFTVDAYPDNNFHGIVDQIRIAPITVQNVVTYDVVIKVDNGDLKLKPGMTANVSVIVASKDGVLKIPNAALRFRPSEKDVPAAKTSSVNKTDTGPSGRAGKGGGQSAPRGYTIWILENDKPKRALVTIGISDGSFTEIASGDVKEGQAVITESVTDTAKKNGSTPPSGSPPRFPR
jgi:HlyD family secretion protein